MYSDVFRIHLMMYTPTVLHTTVKIAYHKFLIISISGKIFFPGTAYVKLLYYKFNRLLKRIMSEWNFIEILKNCEFFLFKKPNLKWHNNLIQIDYLNTFCKNYDTLEINSAHLPLRWTVSHKQQQQKYWIKCNILVKFTFYMKAKSPFIYYYYIFINVLAHCLKNINITSLVVSNLFDEY